MTISNAVESIFVNVNTFMGGAVQIALGGYKESGLGCESLVLAVHFEKNCCVNFLLIFVVMLIINHTICFVPLLAFLRWTPFVFGNKNCIHQATESLSYVVRNARYVYLVIAFAFLLIS